MRRRAAATCFLADRPDVGLRNFATLTDCGSVLDPNSCLRGQVLARGVEHHVVRHAAGWVSLVGFRASDRESSSTATIRARGFFRAVFFFPVLLFARRRGADLEMDPAARGASLNGVSRLGGPGRLQTGWWTPTGPFAWSVFISVWAHMGFYTLILLAGLQAIPRDVYEAATMDRASPWRAFRQDHPAPARPHDAGWCWWLGADQGRADLRRESTPSPAGGRARPRPSSSSTSTRKASRAPRVSSVSRRRPR